MDSGFSCSIPAYSPYLLLSVVLIASDKVLNFISFVNIKLNVLNCINFEKCLCYDCHVLPPSM